MKDVDDMLNIFNEGKEVDIVFTSEVSQDYLMENMRPISLCYHAKKGGPYTITACFSQCDPILTFWERLTMWLRSIF